MMVEVRREGCGHCEAPHAHNMVNWSKGLIPKDDNGKCSNWELKRRDPQQPNEGLVEGEHGEEGGGNKCVLKCPIGHICHDSCNEDVYVSKSIDNKLDSNLRVSIIM